MEAVDRLKQASTDYKRARKGGPSQDGKFDSVKDSFFSLPWNDALSALAAFVAELEERAAAFQEGELNRKKLAQETLHILKSLLQRETASSSLEEGGELFFHNLWEGGAPRDLFTALFREARAIVAGAGVELGSVFSNPAKLQSEIETILSWHLKRRMSLSLAARETQPGDSRECLFGLQVFHDRTYCGMRGFEVRANLRLIGREGQQLWLKVFIRLKGAAVRVADGWELWSDNTDPISPAPGNSRPEFCALVPVNPNSQRMIVEDLRAFVPYAALNLGAGRQEVEIEAGLYDECGESCFRAGQLENIFVPRIGAASESKNILVPSPQAAGIWQKDCASGDQISAPQISRGLRHALSNVHEVISVTLDCNMAGHAGEKVFIECRLLYPDGTLVDSQSECFSNQGTFSYRLELYPQRPVVRLFGLQLQIPLRALALDAGRHELLLEVALLNGQERVLCGTLEYFVCEVEQTLPAAGDESAFLPALPASDPYSGLTVLSFEAEVLGVPGGEERQVVRCDLRCMCNSWERSVFRVISSIETPSGVTLLSKSSSGPCWQTFYLGGYSAGAEKRLVADFDAGDIDFQVKNGASVEEEGACPGVQDSVIEEAQERETVVRLQILTLDDKVLFNLTRTLFLRPGKEQPAGLEASGAPKVFLRDLWIADVEIEARLESKTVSCCFAFGVNFRSAKSAQGTLYCEIIDAAGKSLKQAVLEENGTSRPGSTLRLDFSPQIEAALYRSGCFQEQVIVHVDAAEVFETGRQAVKGAAKGSAFSGQMPENNYYLKAVLFSRDGHLLQIVRYPFSCSSVFSEGELAHSPAADSQSGAGRGSWRKPQRSFLQNIFG